MTDEVFTLKSGRQIAYATFGPENGRQVLYFHGTPSSRLEPLILNAYGQNLEKKLEEHNIKLISIDRPGMGKSDFDPAGYFLSFSIDVHEMISAWPYDQCDLLCWSGGGPYALTLAYQFPQLINRVFIITGFTKSFSEQRVFKNMNGNVYYFWTAKNLPWLMRLVLAIIGRKEAKRPIPKWLSQLPEVDHKLLSDPADIKHFAKCTLNEACRASSRGVVHKAAVYFKQTPYNLAEIKQPVHFWWGRKDNTVSEVHPHAIEMKVPGARMHISENEGHLSVYVNCFDEVLKTIKGELTTA